MVLWLKILFASESSSVIIGSSRHLTTWWYAYHVMAACSLWPIKTSSRMNFFLTDYSLGWLSVNWNIFAYHLMFAQVSLWPTKGPPTNIVPWSCDVCIIFREDLLFAAASRVWMFPFQDRETIISLCCIIISYWDSHCSIQSLVNKFSWLGIHAIVTAGRRKDLMGPNAVVHTSSFSTVCRVQRYPVPTFLQQSISR